MSTYIIRPTSVVSGGGYYAATGAASVLSAINDASDASYVRKLRGTARYPLILALAAPSIAADEFVNHVAPFIRYKGTNGLGNYLSAYPTTRTPVMSGLFANSAAAATIEPGWDLDRWGGVNLSAIRLRYEGAELASDSNRAYVYELGATVYTIKKVAASVSSKTEASSVFPTVPVSVPVVMDAWQLAAPPNDWGNNLLHVPVQVQIELGGTGFGTGTVVYGRDPRDTWTWDYDIRCEATDTYNLDVFVNHALANGTYKVYARAARLSWDGTIVWGDWSSGGTLTMQASPPAAPSITVMADQMADRVSVSVTPAASSGYSDPTIDVERSDDLETTWVPVRGMAAISGSFGVARAMGYDYETPRGSEVRYRARVSATKNGVVNTGAWSSIATATLTADGWNLKCPETPSLNAIGVRIVGDPTEDVDEDIGVFRPLGRRYPVVVAGQLTGWDGSLEIRTSSTAQWQAVKALLESQSVLLLQSPFAEQKYIRITGGVKTVIKGTPQAPRRTVTAAYVEMAQP